MILNSHSAAGKCQLNVMLRQEFREAHDVLILISHLKWKIKQLFFFLFYRTLDSVVQVITESK